MATSVPVPMAIPTSAAASAGVGHCVKHAMRSDDVEDQERKIEEPMVVLARSNA